MGLFFVTPLKKGACKKTPFFASAAKNADREGFVWEKL